MVGVDGSPDSQRALEWGMWLAAREERAVTLLHATDGLLLSRHFRGHPGVLRDAEATAHRLAPEVAVRALSCRESPRSALISASEWASVLVLGARGAGPLGRLRLGSVAHAVSRHCLCPIILTRTAGSARPESVLVGIDGSPASHRVLDFAFRIAEARSWPLTVLHCFWDEPFTTGDLAPGAEPTLPEGRMAIEAVRAVATRHPRVEVETLLSRGFADRRLLAATLEHALVVVGHQELPWLDALVYGHVDPVVVEHAVGDVAVVPIAQTGEAAT